MEGIMSVSRLLVLLLKLLVARWRGRDRTRSRLLDDFTTGSGRSYQPHVVWAITKHDQRRRAANQLETSSTTKLCPTQHHPAPHVGLARRTQQAPARPTATAAATPPAAARPPVIRNSPSPTERPRLHALQRPPLLADGMAAIRARQK